jgi:hypothetical protein
MAANREEVMKVKGSRRLVRRLGLALAVATVLAPNAQAVPQAVDSGGQSRLYADDLHETSTVTSEPGGYAQINEQARPDLVPRNEVRGYAPINQQARPDLVQPRAHVISTSSSEFSWSDAGIGAAVMFGLVLIGFAIVFTRHGRRTRLAAT